METGLEGGSGEKTFARYLQDWKFVLLLATRRSSGRIFEGVSEDLETIATSERSGEVEDIWRIFAASTQITEGYLEE